MGTPPASAALDQMRRAQTNARIGGECAKKSVSEFVNWTDGKSTRITLIAVTGANVRLTSLLSELFVRGGVDGAVLLCDCSQQLMFAQQPGLQAFALGVFERMHVREEAGKGAEKMVSPSNSERVILPDMTRYL
jgi:hypothetical protein